MLSIKNVNVHYNDIVAVNQVTCHVEDGEIVTIIGSNGAGKTSLVRALSGLIPYTSDGVVFNGERIDHLSAHKIVSCGMVQVPEGRGILSLLSVRENLSLGAFTQKDKKKRAQTLEMVLDIFPDLSCRLNQLAGTLSGGQQQMLAIGRGIMSIPKMLMLDEPSLGVAPLLVESIFKVITEINKENVTILLIEQRVRESLELANRGYILQTGKIVLEGTSHELLQNTEIQKHYLGM